jgi:hypothetical protein
MPVMQGFALPEIAVVHQHQVGLGLDGGIEQRLAGGDTTDDAHDLRPAFDLQAIGAVIGFSRCPGNGRLLRPGC